MIIDVNIRRIIHGEGYGGVGQEWKNLFIQPIVANTTAAVISNWALATIREAMARIAIILIGSQTSKSYSGYNKPMPHIFATIIIT